MVVVLHGYQKLDIGLHVQLKVITGTRVAYLGCSNLTTMFTVSVLPHKHTLKH